MPRPVIVRGRTCHGRIDYTRAVVAVAGEFDLPDVEVTVDARGRLPSTVTQRWNAASQPRAPEPFGGPVDAEYETASGVHIAGGGAGRWRWTAPAWQSGRFFEYSITAARPEGAPS